MSRLPSSTGFSPRESRPIFERESGFGEHMMDYGRDLRNTYFTGKSGVLDRVTGAVTAGVSAVLEGPDQAYDGILGRKYEAPAGIAGRTCRDMKLLFNDVFTLHPLCALGDGWRLLTSDWLLDGGDAITGHRLNTLQSRQSATRNQLEQALAA